MEDVIDQILRGELLPLGLAGEVFECSDEKLRKLCELTVGTKRPLGVKFAGAGWSACRVCSMILN